MTSEEVEIASAKTWRPQIAEIWGERWAFPLARVLHARRGGKLEY